MPDSRRELLAWQFELTWALADYHLDALSEDDVLATLAPSHWTVHPDADGVWRPDWAETEPDPVPVPTIGWLTWHIDWWWSTALDQVRGRALRSRASVHWPGTGAAAVARIRQLHTDWLAALNALTDADLDAPVAYPWPSEAGLTVAHLVAWVNAELMKNIAEIGQLRMIRAAA
ncbi:DinB family protein [Nocardia cyriacigeorgica]|uniref:DinB family protein n=1 Tax=Nocardia cyriacigeorgica TaxID=135487 RepID=UPI0018940C85|nr:DinB family protein [Nocardia cyriacigeorgica]MBF6438980.1 DinB family protein [Nocardia cyriacigeorgica]